MEKDKELIVKIANGQLKEINEARKKEFKIEFWKNNNKLLLLADDVVLFVAESIIELCHFLNGYYMAMRDLGIL